MREMQMNVKFKSLHNMDIAVLELHGNFTGGKETDELSKMAHDAFDQGNRKLILDMGNVRYINSMGMGMFMHIHTHYSNSDGKLKLCRVGMHIHNIFVITQLVKIFDIEETQEEAIKKFNN
jgi:anti-sigma B factor antagonist